MEINEILNIESFESKTIEYKEMVNHKYYEKWAKTVAAFANTIGGKLFFGIDDDENIKGIENNQVKEDIIFINNIINNKIHPRIKYDINTININENLFIIEVNVYKSDVTPVWLSRLDEQEVIYVRLDGQSIIAKGDQIEELVLSSKRKPFDKEFSKIKYCDLSLNHLNNVYKQNNEINDEISIKKLQNIDALSINEYASNGLLLFDDKYNGNNTNVVCRLWPGFSKGSSVILDKKEFKGDFLSALDFARVYIKMHTNLSIIKNDGEGRKNIASYPTRAIEEALVNAFSHRDYTITGSQIDVDIYQDRIEITSPGNFILPGNAQDYAMSKIPSRRRNEIICNILELCNLIEQSGSGFEKIEECYKNYSSIYKPKIYSDPAQFIITLYNLTFDSDTLILSDSKIEFDFIPPRSGNREYDQKILDYCLNEPKSRTQIQNYIGLSDRKNFTNSILNPLLDCELLLQTMPNNNSPKQKYYTNKKKISYE